MGPIVGPERFLPPFALLSWFSVVSFPFLPLCHSERAMNVTDELVKEFIRSMKNIQASRYTCGAAMTVMFYDFLLTFADVSTSNLTLLFAK